LLNISGIKCEVKCLTNLSPEIPTNQMSTQKQKGLSEERYAGGGIVMPSIKAVIGATKNLRLL